MKKDVFKKIIKVTTVIILILSIVLVIIANMGTEVRGRSRTYVDAYKEFYLYKVEISYDFMGFPGMDTWRDKIWFLPGQKNKLLNKIKADVNAELSQIAKENSDIIKDFKISDDFKKIHIYCYNDSTNSRRFGLLAQMLTEKIACRVELYFQILNGYGKTSYDGDILNYVEESNNYSAYNENVF